MKQIIDKILAAVLCTVLSTSFTACTSSQTVSSKETHMVEPQSRQIISPAGTPSVSLSDIPTYSGSPYVEINDGQPFFSDEELQQAQSSFEQYSELDELGRCGTAMASISKDTMPTEPRKSIGMIRPSGWHTVRYDDLIEDRYLYNRCHLIAYELAGENANEKNLITGTRYMNVEGMPPWENDVADYVKSYGGHVLYRVTPVFYGDNLVSSGVLMEAESVENQGAGLKFCVYCYNVQPGITIDYATGDSSREEAAVTETETSEEYIGNRNSHKFHYSWCDSVRDMKDKNKVYFVNRDEAVEAGYEPCQRCNP